MFHSLLGDNHCRFLFFHIPTILRTTLLNFETKAGNPMVASLLALPTLLQEPPFCVSDNKQTQSFSMLLCNHSLR